MSEKMTTSEPSTDIEITLKKPKNDELLVKGGGSGREPIDTECAVRALNTIAEVSPQWSGAIRFAADRLESQEREIERLKEELEQMEEAATILHAANETHWTYIKEQTSRAEQAALAEKEGKHV